MVHVSIIYDKLAELPGSHKSFVLRLWMSVTLSYAFSQCTHTAVFFYAVHPLSSGQFHKAFVLYKGTDADV